MEKKLSQPTHVYVGRDDGGCALAICSDYRDKFSAESVAGMIIAGLTVSRVDWQTYKDVVSLEETFMNCSCEPKPKLQPALFEEEKS